MSRLVTQEAPDFTATAVMEDGAIKEIALSSYRGKNVLLFFYPLDFTFVCPSEIIAFDKKVAEFKERNTEVIGVSVDSEWTHNAWRNTAIKEGGIGQVKFPLVADLNKQIARDYDVLLDGKVALRGTFLIDTKGVVRHAVINDLPLGRSIDEALRMVDALLFHEKHGEVCPANWTQGKEAMKANPEGVADYLSKNA